MPSACLPVFWAYWPVRRRLWGAMQELSLEGFAPEQQCVRSDATVPAATSAGTPAEAAADCQLSHLQVARFNTSHTVADIRRFICAARPDMPTTYRLVTAFPPAQLDDNAATIAGAGLANAVVIQKL